MKLDYARNAKNPTYFIAASVRNGNRVSTVKVETIGRHSDLLKITDDPLAYAKKKVEEYNRNLKEKVITCTAEIDLNEIIPDPGSPASKSTYVNIGYFFLQTIYQKLMLDSFFAEATGDKKVTFDCGSINRFLTYARILDPKSKLGTFDDLDAYYEKRQRRKLQFPGGRQSDSPERSGYPHHTARKSSGTPAFRWHRDRTSWPKSSESPACPGNPTACGDCRPCHRR